MNFASGPVKAVTTASSVIFVAIIILIVRGYEWPTLSSGEVINIRAALDSSLFHGDFAVDEGLRFTPRFYYDKLIELSTQAGLPLAWSFAFWHFVALLILVHQSRSIARTLGLGELAWAAWLVWVLCVGAGMLGSVYFYTYAPVPAIWAGVLAVGGTAAALKGRWAQAGAWFGAATLIQFLVGFYAGLLALPAFLLWGGRQRIVGLALWALGLALVYVPMRFSGGTGSALLDNATFVYLYGQLRVPHHIVPSTWGWSVWFQALTFYAGAGWFLHKTAAEPRRVENFIFAYVVGLTALMLALNYYFIEIHPLALIAKLQPGRITPLAQLVVLTLLATRIQARVAQRDWASAALIFLALLTRFPGCVLFLAAILLPKPGEKKSFSWEMALLAVMLAFAFQPFEPDFALRSKRYLWFLGMAAVVSAPASLGRTRWRRSTLVALLAIDVAFLSLVISHPQRGPFPLGGISIETRPFDAFSRLGERFRTNAPLDAVVLIPTTDAWMFKLYSSHGAVVENKNSPYTDRGQVEWKKRMERVLGVELKPGLDEMLAWQKLSVSHLVEVAQAYGARYVLTRDEWHSGLPGRSFDYEEGWRIWELSPAK